MFLFFIFYINLRCLIFIEEIFKDIQDDLKNNNEHQMFYETFKNIAIYTFYSSEKSCIVNDLIDINESTNILDLLLGDKFYFVKKRILTYSMSYKNNIYLREILSEILESSKYKPRTIQSIRCLKNCKSKEILESKKEIIKTDLDQKITVEDIKMKSVFERGTDKLLIVSNVVLDFDILLIVLKTLKTYDTVIQFTHRGFINFMVLKFVDFEAKEKFNEIIQGFYQNLYLRENFDHYIKSPIIIAEYQKNNAILQNQTKSEEFLHPKFKIRSLFEIDTESTEYKKLHLLEDNLDIFHLKTENRNLISKRPKVALIYFNYLAEENKKQFYIYSRIFNTAINILCQTYEEILDRYMDGSEKIKRISTIYIYCDDDIIQKVNLVTFYKSKKLEPLGNVEICPNEILLTDQIFKKFKKNIFLLLNPKFTVFYNFNYLTYDFLTSDFIFYNVHSEVYHLKVMANSIKQAYESIADIIYNFASIHSCEYDLYCFDCVNQSSYNVYNILSFRYKDFLSNFINVTSFKKIDYKKDLIRKKIEHIEEIIILLENKSEIQNSIYIVLNVRYTLLNFFKRSYVEILKKEIEELNVFNFYISQESLPIEIVQSLKKQIQEIMTIFCSHLRDPYIGYDFKYFTIEYIGNFEKMKIFIFELLKKLNYQSSLYQASSVEISIYFLFRINRFIIKYIFERLIVIKKTVYFDVFVYTPAFQKPADLKAIENELSEFMVESLFQTNFCLREKKIKNKKKNSHRKKNCHKNRHIYRLANKNRKRDLSFKS